MDGISQKSIDDAYFDSYQDLEVHKLMLEDAARTKAYEDAILKHGKQVFEGKVVMDVGAGTGILSLFCAKAGAKKVYALEASSLAKQLPEIFAKNGFQDIVQVVHKMAEEVTDIGREVDIIVSEWMGFYLMHESMISSVLFARDKFLKKGGLMYPNKAEIFAAPCSAIDLWDKQHFWTKKHYGFDFSPLQKVFQASLKPEITNIEPSQLLASPQKLWHIDLDCCAVEDLYDFSDRRFMSIEEDGVMHALCLWFTCDFPSVTEKQDPCVLSTAPWDNPTHWKQTLLLFPTATECETDDILGWNLRMRRSESNFRQYNITAEMLDPNEKHPVPCQCGMVTCEIIKKYIEDHESKTS